MLWIQETLMYEEIVDWYVFITKLQLEKRDFGKENKLSFLLPCTSSYWIFEITLSLQTTIKGVGF